MFRDGASRGKSRLNSATNESQELPMLQGPAICRVRETVFIGQVRM